MRKALTTAAALAILAVLAAMLTTAAAARPASAKQHVSIDEKGNSNVLTVSSGAIPGGKFTMTACCWTRRHVVVAGQRLEVDNPHLTFTGANGTLVFRNRIEWVDVPGGLGIFSGTWRVVGGTGAYRSISGHGRVVGVQTAGGYDRAHFFGFLTSSG
jgi:hypothetical protein